MGEDYASYGVLELACSQPPTAYSLAAPIKQDDKNITDFFSSRTPDDKHWHIFKGVYTNLTP